MFFSPDFKSEPQIINAACFGSRQEVISSLILPLSKFKGSHYTTGVGRWRGAPASPPDTLRGSTQGSQGVENLDILFVHELALHQWLPLGY